MKKLTFSFASLAIFFLFSCNTDRDKNKESPEVLNDFYRIVITHEDENGVINTPIKGIQGISIQTETETEELNKKIKINGKGFTKYPVLFSVDGNPIATKESGFLYADENYIKNMSFGISEPTKFMNISYRTLNNSGKRIKARILVYKEGKKVDEIVASEDLENPRINIFKPYIFLDK